RIPIAVNSRRFSPTGFIRHARRTTDKSHSLCALRGCSRVEEISVSDRHDSWSRREFLSELIAAGAAGSLGPGVSVVAAEPPPETTTLRVLRTPSLCEAPA